MRKPDRSDVFGSAMIIMGFAGLFVWGVLKVSSECEPAFWWFIENSILMIYLAFGLGTLSGILLIKLWRNE